MAVVALRVLCSVLLVGFPMVVSGELVGNYGALTDFNFEDCSMEEATERIREMGELGVREFQFYDVVPSYSPQHNTPQWQTLFGNNKSACWTGETWMPPYTRSRSMCRQCIQNLVTAIHAVNGQAWLYAQSVAADEFSVNYSAVAPSCVGDECLADWIHTSSKGHASTGDGDNRLFYCYRPTATWGKWQATQYSRVATLFEFDGIHWDSLGMSPCGGTDANDFIKETGYSNYLNGTKQILMAHGLKQTFNFVDNSAFNKSKVENMTEFNYVECWDQGCLNEFIQPITGAGSEGGAVVAFYPCKNDTFFIDMFGWSAKHGNSYLVVADGLHYLTNEYFPNSLKAPMDPFVQTRASIVYRECGPAPCKGGSGSCQKMDFQTPVVDGNCHDWGCK